MMGDAVTKDAAAVQRYEAAKAREEKDKADLERRGSSPSRQAKFIKSMNSAVYLNNDETLSDRLSKNKHYRQKGNVEEHAFIKDSN
jgi:hypothetical protein